MSRFLVIAVFVLGCGGGEDQNLAMRKGTKWTFVVAMDGDESIEEVVVIDRAPVGPYSGWLLDSAMGQSRLAWNEGTLYAAELSGSIFSPPIPICARRETRWEGVVISATESTAGTAVLKRSAENLVLGGKTYATVKATLLLSCGKDKVELTTWFYPDLGILRQEQRSGPNMLRDRKIDFVSAD